MVGMAKLKVKIMKNSINSIPLSFSLLRKASILKNNSEIQTNPHRINVANVIKTMNVYLYILPSPRSNHSAERLGNAASVLSIKSNDNLRLPMK